MPVSVGVGLAGERVGVARGVAAGVRDSAERVQVPVPEGDGVREGDREGGVSDSASVRVGVGGLDRLPEREGGVGEGEGGGRVGVRVADRVWETLPVTPGVQVGVTEGVAEAFWVLVGVSSSVREPLRDGLRVGDGGLGLGLGVGGLAVTEALRVLQDGVRVAET